MQSLTGVGKGYQVESLSFQEDGRFSKRTFGRTKLQQDFHSYSLCFWFSMAYVRGEFNTMLSVSGFDPSGGDDTGYIVIGKHLLPLFGDNKQQQEVFYSLI